MSSEVTDKTFKWNSVKDAKGEYFEAYSMMCNLFREKGVGYVMNRAEVAQRRGTMPEPIPENANIALRTPYETKI